MKTKLIAVSLWTMCFPHTLWAGEIFGTLLEKDQPIANANIELTIEGKNYSAKTDAEGSYRIFVPENGRATVSVDVQGKKAAMDLFSSERSVRYDLKIENNNGKTELKRK